MRRQPTQTRTCTLPSFLPCSSYNSTPIHIPVANRVSPKKRTIPRWRPETVTTSPSSISVDMASAGAFISASSWTSSSTACVAPSSRPGDASTPPRGNTSPSLSGTWPRCRGLDQKSRRAGHTDNDAPGRQRWWSPPSPQPWGLKPTIIPQGSRLYLIWRPVRVPAKERGTSL